MTEMNELTEELSPLLPTGVPGLDPVLKGGLFRSRLFLLHGPPGSGKTVLANHLAFNVASTGANAIYITLLGAEHSTLLASLTSFRFFREEFVGTQVVYFDGYSTLQKEGMDGLASLIRHEVRARRPALLVLDGATLLEVFASDLLAFTEFLRALQVYAASFQTTILLLAYQDVRPHPPAGALADGVIELRATEIGHRMNRYLHVTKYRGHDFLLGAHLFEIVEEGIVVYPRTEALLKHSRLRMPATTERVPFGIPGLDAMLQGGLLSASTTMLLGVPGSGKTPFGLHLLAEGARQGENVLHFGFHETPSRLLYKSEQLGVPLRPFLEERRLSLLWQPPLEHNLDPLAAQLLQAIEERKVQRLFVDGLDVFQTLPFYDERHFAYLAAVSNELRRRNVTTVITADMDTLISPHYEVPVEGVSAIFDTILLLREVEVGAQLHHLITIFKMRASRFDTSTHEFWVTEHGIEVAATAESAETILSRVRPASSDSPTNSQAPPASG